MIIHEFDLDMVPGLALVEKRLNQYDDDFRLKIHLVARAGTFTVAAGTTVAIRGTKPDGNGFSADASLDVSSSTVTVIGDQQMTAACGKALFEVTLYNSGKELNSANFILRIEPAALDRDTVASDSKVRELYDIYDKADEIIAAGAQYESAEAAMRECAAEAAASEESAAASAAAALATKDEVETTGETELAKIRAAGAAAMSDINEKADMIAALTTDADQVARRALATANNVENELAEVSNKADKNERAVNALQFESQTYAQELEVDDNGLVYLLNNGERIAGPYGPFAGGGGGGGGGGSGNNAVLTVTNNSGWLSKTIADGDAAVARINWTSIEDEMPTGDGNARITVNGVVKAILNVQQGDISIDLAKYATVGANVIKVNLSDVYDNNRTINFSVTVVSISISSTFDATTPYQSAISFPYTPVGSVEKTVYFILDGRQIGSTTTSVSNRQMTFTIPQQSHGAHTLECYFQCEINGQLVDSNHLYYEFIALEVLNTTPIIVSSYKSGEAVQYETLHVDYTVYDPTSLTAPVVLSVNGNVVSRQTVDRTQQVFTYRVDEIGTVNIRIATGEVSKVITVEVEESDIDVEPETDQLMLYLSSAGRSNNEANPGTWAYGAYSATFSGFNWKSDGWLNDADGTTALRVAGDARVTIPYQAFASDFRTSGKTIEIEFATRDVMNYDSVIMSCLSGGRGFSLTAQLAKLMSEQSVISMQYKEEEHVRVSFVVEKRSKNRLMYIYVNGIMSGVVQYPTNDDFQQTNPVGISIGSNDCTIDLYNIRIYDNDLTRHQILTNWIADTPDVGDMLARYQRNGVYDEYGNIVIAQLPTDLPYMIIECAELPQFKGDKKTVAVTYTDPVTTSKSFTAEGVQADVQGTSSQYYARKNYKLKFKNGLTLAGGTKAAKYQLRPGAIATSTFCMKADVASSEGANNVELARLYNDTCPYRTPPQKTNAAIRQGIDGFPIVIFWSDGENTTFLGKYNFNNDKSTEEVFGFTAGDESFEVKNNTSDRVLWKNADYTTSDWLNDFEARYPDTDPAYEDPTKLAELAAWLVSTDQTAATGDALPSAYTDVDGTTHTVDNAAYRLAKFKTEISDHMELESAIFYYLFTELFLMVDSRAKNAFPSHLGTDKWCWLPYDFDTALGINNEGALVFSYNLEDTDTIEGGADVYNGQQSVMWINLRQAFFDEIKTMYQDLRSSGALSYAKVEGMFEEHQGKWSEAIFNEDAYFKYLQPLIDDGSGAYLAMLQGSKTEQRKWWMYNRFRYMDSKYNAGDAQSDVIQLRGYAKSNVTVTPYADVYASVKFGSYLVQTRANRGTAYTLVCPLDNVNDTEIYVYSASQLASVGDLSGLKVGYADFSMATKLQSIKLGDSASGYSNGNMKELYLGNNVLLRTIDVRNCVGLGTGDMKSVDISGCSNIENVYFDGTNVTGVDLPNGGILKILHLPATITNLTILNQPSITNLTIPSYTNISTLRLENVSSAVNSKAILTAISAASRVRLIGFAWEASNYAEIISLLDKLDTMRGLDEYGNNMETAQVSGTIHTSSLTGAQMATIEERLEAYPYLQVSADHVTSYLTYKTYDGSSTLKTVTCIDGTPQEAAPSGPSRSSTAQYSYSFVGWNTEQDATTADSSCITNVWSDRTVYAAYSRTVRTYTITWKNSDNTVLETDTNVPYGSTPQYNGSTPQNPTAGGGAFQGWSPTVVTVTGDATYTASYVVTYTATFVRAAEDGGGTLYTQTGLTQGTVPTYGGSTPTSTRGDDYTFNGWTPALSGITANTTYTAQFKAPSGVEVPTATSADGAYGVEWDYSQSSTTLTRKGLAASFADPVPATSLAASGSSPFDSIQPWAGMKKYNIIDGTVSYSEDDAGFSETDYDTVVYIPEFYYTAYKDTANSKWLWAISPTAKEGFVKHPGSGRYIGRFHTSGDATAVYSKSGVAPLHTTSRTNFRTYSHSKGTKWFMLDIATWSALQMLYIVEFADWHSQSKLGKGYGNNSQNCGASTGAVYHTVNGGDTFNVYRWVEQPFGRVYDWVDGFVASSRVVYTGTDNASFSDSRNDLTATGITLPSTNFITGFGYSEECPYAFIPDAASEGSLTTYVPDRVSSSTGEVALYVGGGYSSSDYYGFFCTYAYDAASTTGGYIGSRLLYIP